MEMIDAIREAAPYLESWLEFQRDKVRQPGVQAAIRVRGELAFSVALGVSDVDTGERLTVDHLFHIASHSKTVTATAVLQLVERGVLRLDDKAATWVPEVAGTPAGEATLRELLGHQAGVNRDSQECGFWSLDGDFPDRAALVARLGEDTIYGPNEHFKYSNMGYGLLGLVLEAATGRSYAEVVTEGVVEPLGLRNLGPEVPAERIADLAGGHTLRFAGDDPVRVIPHVGTGALAAATGCYGTAEDTTAYLSAHAFGREELLTDASKRLMQRRESTITRGGERWYGLGLQLVEIGGRTLVGHSGGWPGHITQSWLDPVSGLCVSVFTNALGGPAAEWARALVAWVDLLTSNVEHGEVDGVDPDSFTGRFAGMWGIEDIAHLGGRLWAIAPTSTDPATAATELTVVDADTLAPVPEAGYGAVGEPYTFERADGRIVAVRCGGSAMRPLEEYRRSVGLA